MAERGHRVHLFHVDFYQANATSLDDIDWFSFPPGVIHHFPPSGPIEIEDIPPADVIFGYTSEGTLPPQAGLPVVFIQGYKMLGENLEHPAFLSPCPKVCVASWLVDVGRRLGVPERQLVHVPLGLRHEKYRVRRPIAQRPPLVSFCYSAHVQKGAHVALKVLRRAKEVVPELEATVFSTVAPTDELPDWLTFRTNPSQHDLVDEIYNQSRVFLCASEVEGFGLTNVEAMACGAALVTTDNGGSRDYAHHGDTALVAPTGDVEALAGHIVRLVRDDAECLRIATAGRDYVDRFEWDRSARMLEDFLESYRADPVAYGRPRG
jgi:glycosyltransferase involved in cell wall biosynthesis